MKTKYYYFFILTVILTSFLTSCKNGTAEDTDSINDSIARQDSLSRLKVTQDSLHIADSLATTRKVFKDPEVQEAHEKIVKKYGVQWNFCKCVVKNDSINNALMKDGLTDKQTDKLLKRMDEIGKKCKDMLIQPNSTPEERSEYKRKVRNCLKNAK